MAAGFFLRGAGAALVGVALALPAWAEDIALVLGNRAYRNVEKVAEGDSVVDAAGALRDNGVAVVAGQDVTLREMRGLTAQFEQMAPAADGLLVVLSGRFVHSTQETWFLPVDSDLPGLTALGQQALPLSVVLALLSEVPGRAVLVLASDDSARERGAFLTDGVGGLNVPQGVTVVRGAPRPAARLLRDVLAVPGATLDGALRDDDGLHGAGYLPEGYGFLDDGRAGAGGRELADARERINRLTDRLEQAQRDAEQARAAAARDRQRLAAAETAVWQTARDEDTATGYRRYLDAFPEGEFADRAQRALGAIRDEPNRNARLAEESLNLSRERRQQIQRDLSILGFNTRGIDGIFGPGTRAAIANWQSNRNLQNSGYLDQRQIAQLRNEAADKAAQLREDEARRQEELRRQDRAYWQQLDEGRTEAGLRAYLERYPDGQFADRARARLKQIADDRGPQPEAQQDRLAWSRAQTLNTPAAFRDYLQRFPNGEFAEQARARLVQFEQQGNDDAAARAGEERLGLTSFTRRAIEQRLSALGFDPGMADGEFDGETRRAIRQYQAGADLPVTGYLSEGTVVRLLADSVRDILR